MEAERKHQQHSTINLVQSIFLFLTILQARNNNTNNEQQTTHNNNNNNSIMTSLVAPPSLEVLPTTHEVLPRHNQNLTLNERQAVVHFLLPKQSTTSAKLPKGAFKESAALFGVTARTCSRVWKMYLETVDPETCPAGDVSTNRKNCGRKSTFAAVEEAVKKVSYKDRSDLRTLSAASGIARTTLGNYVKKGQILRHSGAVKPFLTEKNKKARVEFALSLIKPDGKFEDMYDTIHIDEKWFYLKTTNQKTYLCSGEPEPHSTCKSKRFIEKVMFLCAVARPRHDADRNAGFDGKIGIWPFVVKEPAQRNSVNRPRGTMVTKNIPSVNAAEYQKMMLEKVLPAIQEKFPVCWKSRPIFIQEDNAKPHHLRSRAAVREAAREAGWNITVTTQPPNSPDFNVLDLGFFASIQALQYKKRAKNIDQLIANVEEALVETSTIALNSIFLSLQCALEESIKVQGNNSYKLRHMGKEKLLKEDNLPVSITCDADTVTFAQQTLAALNMREV
uniref:Tranposase n=1 Tax=Pseudo-nitzschia multiseries TaxID=37319 RepID=I6THG9_PSEMU|nr:tranposase [Pseudo-nitzschia multiseries]